MVLLYKSEDNHILCKCLWGALEAGIWPHMQGWSKAISRTKGTLGSHVKKLLQAREPLPQDNPNREPQDN